MCTGFLFIFYQNHFQQTTPVSIIFHHTNILSHLFEIKKKQELICKGWFLPPNTYDCGSFVVNVTAAIGKESKYLNNSWKRNTQKRSLWNLSLKKWAEHIVGRAIIASRTLNFQSRRNISLANMVIFWYQLRHISRGKYKLGRYLDSAKPTLA